MKIEGAGKPGTLLDCLRPQGGWAAPMTAATAILPAIGAAPARASSLGLDGLGRSIVLAVAYADVFEHALTAEEIHRYLVGLRVSRRAVDQALASGRIPPRHLARAGRFYTLPGREELAAIRGRRERASAGLWRRATRYGAIFGCLPFVRMVAVTGSLAMNNAEADSDVDYLIVTRPGRLWLGRLVVMVVARLASRRGSRLCVNYLLSERALEIRERTHYAARELSQMVPLSGWTVYQRMLAANAWARRVLPNASDPPPRALWGPLREPLAALRALRWLAEACLVGPPGAWLERNEMRIKTEMLRGTPDPCDEARFSRDEFKSHFAGHGRRTMHSWSQRLRELGRVTA